MIIDEKMIETEYAITVTTRNKTTIITRRQRTKTFKKKTTCVHVYEQRRKRAVWITYTKRCYTATSIQDIINSSVFVISITEQYMYKKNSKKNVYTYIHALYGLKMTSLQFLPRQASAGNCWILNIGVLSVANPNNISLQLGTFPCKTKRIVTFF